jgi:hypothetical protein
MNAVLDFINKTSSIKSVYLAARWELWLGETVDSLETTIQVYFSMNVKVYVIQQTPYQFLVPGNSNQIYKLLFDKGQLTDAKLRNVSCTRREYSKMQTGVEQLFSKFKEIRGLTFIYIEDIICDAEVCPVGTGKEPYFVDPAHMTPPGAHRLKARFQKYLSY